VTAGLRGCFVTGTDTGVDKSVVAAAIAAALADGGTTVRALKPVITGLDEPAQGGWPHDHELLAIATGRAPEEVALFSYGPAVSPHLAGQLADRPLDPAALRGAVLTAAAGSEAVVVEGVGGLLVPLTDGYDVRAFARDLELPLVVAARPGLGTINHALLTLEAARRSNLMIAAVVLTPWPSAPGRIELSNFDTLQRRGEVPVATLPHVAGPDRELLAQAGRTLPLQQLVA
jgi:dethiobiotin synthetase